MSLVLHLHPLSSFCHKVLMALYENGTPFEPCTVNMMEPQARAAYLKLSPFGKIPALEDTERGRIVNEASIMIEYLQQHYPGPAKLIPNEADAALNVRLWDRIVDTYLHYPMQRIVGDTLRPEGQRDPRGVEEARATIATALDQIERQLAHHSFLTGDQFSLADCAAMPPLFYLQAIAPYAASHPNISAYFERMLERPCYARALDGAKPFLKYFPFADALPSRFKA